MTLAKRLQFSPSGLAAILSINHPDLLAMWTMDNISGVIILDESPGGNDATHTTTPAFSTGVIGNALDTTSRTSGVATTDPFIPITDTQGAVSYWAKYTGSLDVMINFMILGIDGATINVRVDPTDMSLFVVDNIGFVTAAQLPIPMRDVVMDGEWHHWVCQSNSSSYNVYLDGVDQSLNFQAGSDNGAWWDVATDVTLGKFQLGDNNTEGQTDQLRYFNRALTLQEVTDLFDEGTP